MNANSRKRIKRSKSLRFSILIGLLVIMVISLAGCGGGVETTLRENDQGDQPSGEEGGSPVSSDSDGSVQFFSPSTTESLTPIPTVEILVEAADAGLEISFYSVGMLENGEMQVSFNSPVDIPDGQYQALIQTEDGSEVTYTCTFHPSLPKLILCRGVPLSEGEIVSLSIIESSVVEGQFDFSQAQLVSDQVAGGAEITNPWQAWEMVNRCALLSASGEFSPTGCEAFAAFTPKQSECSGPATCALQCGQDLDLDVHNAGFNPTEVWEALAPDSMALSAACQDFVSLQKWPWSMPLSMTHGISSTFFALLINQFEDPFFLDNPLLGFDDPLLGFDDPLLGFDDPLLGFDDPLLGFDDPLLGFDDPLLGFDDPLLGFDDPLLGFEDPFFFGAPDADFEDPFFLSGPNMVLGELVLTSDHAAIDASTASTIVAFPGLKERFAVATGANPMSLELFNSFLPDPGNTSLDPNLGGSGAGGPNSPQDGGASSDGEEAPPILEGVTVDLGPSTLETFYACVGLLGDPSANGWDVYGEFTDYYFSQMIRAYRMRLTYYDFGEYHPECATPEVLTVLENYESYMWTKAPAGLEQCAVEMGHDIHDFMRFSPSDVPQYEYYYPAFCSQLQAYSDGAPQQLPASCQATEFLENFVDAGYCQNAQEIPFVVYECLGALAEIKGSELPLFQENIGGLYAGDGYDRLVHLNNPGSFEEAFYITYLDYWEDPEVYGDWSTWPPACETTEFMDWLEQAEQNRYGIDPTTDSPYENCETCSTVYDCSTSPNLFYCGESSPENDLFTDTATQCAQDISWPGDLETPQHTANLVAYLTTAAPWMVEDSMTDACETTIANVASFSPGLYPGYLRTVLGIWGTNGTSIWGIDQIAGSTWARPFEFQVPYLLQPEETQSGGGSGSSVCAPQPCGPGEYWDSGLCMCWAN